MSMVEDQRPVWVFPLLLLGVLSFASSAILIRYAAAVPSLAVAVWRTLIASALLTPMGAPATWKSWKSMSAKDAGLIALAGFLLGIHFVSWIESIYHTSVGSAAVLVSTGPIFMALFGWLLIGERLSRRTTLAIVVAVLGSVLLALGEEGANAPEGGNPMLGNAMALFAAMVWAFYLLIGRVVRRRLDWLPYVYPLYGVAALTTLSVALVRGVDIGAVPPHILLLCALMAIFPQILGHGSFNYAVKYFPAAILGLLGLLEPIGASLLAFALFAEVPGPLAFVGMAMILAAVGSTVIGGNTDPPETD